MTTANIVILHEVIHPHHKVGDWRLCLHWGRYQYDNGEDPQLGYRFMWRRPDGSLQAGRGQARILSKKDVFLLFELATKEGWGDLEADDYEAVSDTMGFVSA